ncbi:MAG: endonuclease [Acidobacteria bacterium]|nr:endonuclease [Acidobacteriota bacterium]
MKIHRRSVLLVALAWLPVVAQESAPPRRITVLSYNIHHGEGTDAKVDLERIAALIRAASPDLVALQEVDRVTRRTGGVNQAQDLACFTGMQYFFGRTIDYQGGMYGNAVLSRLPVNGFANRALPFTPGREARGVAQAHIYSGPTESGHALFRFFATHLDTSEADRLKAVPAILEFASEEPDLPTILAGDLNALPDSAPMKLLAQGFEVAAAGEFLPTYPAGAPQRQIDFILYRPADRWRVVEVRVIEESVASDHRPILAVLELLPPAQASR